MIRAATATAAMLGAAVTLAACGGSSSPSKASKKTSYNRSGAALKLSQCMRTHGVPDFPDPPSGGHFAMQQSSDGNGGGSITVDGRKLNASAPAFQNAMQACQKFQPKGPPVSGAQLAKLQKGALKMAECMRTHGVPNFPDPTVSTGPDGRGVGIRLGAKGSAINPQSPAFQAAQKTCMPLIGGPKGLPTKKAGS